MTFCTLPQVTLVQKWFLCCGIHLYYYYYSRLLKRKCIIWIMKNY
nr:MAG TPA: hypothetical protein [Caudoviricetes sp.]